MTLPILDDRLHSRQGCFHSECANHKPGFEMKKCDLSPLKGGVDSHQLERRSSMRPRGSGKKSGLPRRQGSLKRQGTGSWRGHCCRSCTEASSLPARLSDSNQQSHPAKCCSPVSWTSVRDFQVLRKIGATVMSTVFLARCKTTQQPVALKVYRKDALSPALLNQVRWEIDCLRRLSECTYVYRLLAILEDADFIRLVLEYCPGGDVYWLKGRWGGFLPEWKVASEVMVPLLHALKAMHQQGMVHRDVKPENLFLAEGGSVKLGDFGLSISQRKAHPRCVVGTLDYLAPEVLLQSKDIDFLLNTDTGHTFACDDPAVYGCNNPAAYVCHNARAEADNAQLWTARVTPVICSTVQHWSIDQRPAAGNRGAAVDDSAMTLTGCVMDGSSAGAGDVYQAGTAREYSTRARNGRQVVERDLRTPGYGSGQVGCDTRRGEGYNKRTREGYDEKVDVWAAGCTAYELLLGNPPFELPTVVATKRAILTRPIPWDAGEQLSRSCMDFLTRALDKDPTRRPSAHELLQHPWIQQHALDSCPSVQHTSDIRACIQGDTPDSCQRPESPISWKAIPCPKSRTVCQSEAPGPGMAARQTVGPPVQCFSPRPRSPTGPVVQYTPPVHTSPAGSSGVAVPIPGPPGHHPIPTAQCSVAGQPGSRGWLSAVQPRDPRPASDPTALGSQPSAGRPAVEMADDIYQRVKEAKRQVMDGEFTDLDDFNDTDDEDEYLVAVDGRSGDQEEPCVDQEGPQGRPMLLPLQAGALPEPPQGCALPALGVPSGRRSDPPVRGAISAPPIDRGVTSQLQDRAGRRVGAGTVLLGGDKMQEAGGGGSREAEWQLPAARGREPGMVCGGGSTRARTNGHAIAPMGNQSKPHLRESDRPLRDDFVARHISVPLSFGPGQSLWSCVEVVAAGSLTKVLAQMFLYEGCLGTPA